MKLRLVRILFEPRDIWVGVYWKREHLLTWIYVCIIPMLPIRLTFERGCA